MKKKAVKKASGIQKINGHLIPKGSEAYRDFAFLIHAATNDITRPMMQGVHVEKDGNKTLYVCTDGRRLHALEYEDRDGELAPGEYDIRISEAGLILCPKPVKTVFPNWRKVIPVDNHKHFTIELAPKNAKLLYSQSLFSLFETINGCISVDFLEPLTDPLCNKWEVSFKNGTSAVIFRAGARRAMIMPTSKPKAIEIHETKRSPLVNTVHTIATGEGKVIAEVKNIDITKKADKKAA